MASNHLGTRIPLTSRSMCCARAYAGAVLQKPRAHSQWWMGGAAARGCGGGAARSQMRRTWREARRTSRPCSRRSCAPCGRRRWRMDCSTHSPPRRLARLALSAAAQCCYPRAAPLAHPGAHAYAPTHTAAWSRARKFPWQTGKVPCRPALLGGGPSSRLACPLGSRNSHAPRQRRAKRVPSFNRKSLRTMAAARRTAPHQTRARGSCGLRQTQTQMLCLLARARTACRSAPSPPRSPPAPSPPPCPSAAAFQIFQMFQMRPAPPPLPPPTWRARRSSLCLRSPPSPEAAQRRRCW
mmetsp:Transcript_43302/g.106944  ORF Transcript_43302/g.106944 Transcript_43302/m.106944 type:complete len:296 (-) Transcript_43302:1877-2764(-)